MTDYITSYPLFLSIYTFLMLKYPATNRFLFLYILDPYKLYLKNKEKERNYKK